MRRYFVLNILLLFLLASAGVFAAKPVVTKFVILDPADSTVDTAVTVTIEAQKSNNQVDTSYQSDVTLVASGSATGAGLVDIIDGVGTIQINDTVAETVTLSLSDTEGTGLDVSSTQDVVFAEEGAGEGIWKQIKFWFRDDDGDEISATGFGAGNEDANVNSKVAPGTNFRLRFLIKVTDDDGAIIPQLEFMEGTNCAGEGWTVITPDTSVFTLKLSSNFDDGTATTQQLVGGPNFVAGKILELTNPAPLFFMTKQYSTEYEWSLRLSENAPFPVQYSFRITNNGDALDVYEQCPILTTFTKKIGVPTTVSFSGVVFPEAKIAILDKSLYLEEFTNMENVLKRGAYIRKDGIFASEFVGIISGQHSFGLLIKDPEGRTAQTKFFNLSLDSNDTIVKNVIVPPTIGFASRLVPRGRDAVVKGYAAPRSTVVIEIDDTIKKEVTAEDDGSYRAEVNTGPSEFGSHRVRVKQITWDLKRESDFSPLSTFVVSRLLSPKTDLSGDGSVDIRDWSMFLSFWGKRKSEEAEIIDFNGDGQVDIADFSIFVRNIRKR